MRRTGLIVALAVAIPLLFAPTAAAHATCSSHTRWFSGTRYVVTSAGASSCRGDIYRLSWTGWKWAGSFRVPR